MRKRVVFRQLGRAATHRMAMLKNMATSLIKHERIMTTTAKAKELRRVVEKLITHAKRGKLINQRKASAIVQERPQFVKLFYILGPRYKNRNGGYTRVMKLGKPRRGDSADMSFIELVDREGELRRPRPARGTLPLSTGAVPAGGVVMDIIEKMNKVNINN